MLVAGLGALGCAGLPIRLVLGFARPPCERGYGLWVLPGGGSAQELLQGKGRALEITSALTGVPFGSPHARVTSLALQRAMRPVTEA